MLRRWLARLSFSFIILAAVLTWEGYKIATRDSARSQRSLYYFVAAGACAAIGLAGVRQRHRLG